MYIFLFSARLIEIFAENILYNLHKNIIQLKKDIYCNSMYSAALQIQQHYACFPFLSCISFTISL